jgi:predicted nuclease of restriction endonuclease-like (RecB) superfamily
MSAKNRKSKASRPARALARKQTSKPNRALSDKLINEIRELIETARERVAQTVNAGMTLLYWQIGRRIHQDILKEKRAAYGAKIVASLSRQLVAEYGSGFTEKNLRRMVQFAEAFPEKQIVVSLIRQLSWTHFIALLPLKEPIQREFYAEMCRVERWSVRTLRQKIDSMLYERTALSKKPVQLATGELQKLREEDRLTPDLVFRDPYFLDFLGLKNAYSEKDLEAAILREMERFILELGAGFAFMERQKRITIDQDDYYLDLLFYHRKLRRLVAMELKLGKFQAADKGQMELYLRWLDRYERDQSEGSPLGIILCAGKSTEHVELLELDKSGIHVASYLTELPPRNLLQKKLKEAIAAVKARLEPRSIEDETKT